MKKSVFIVLGVLACFAVFGCGQKSSQKTAAGKIFRIAAVDPQVPLDMQSHTYSIIMRITDNIGESLLTTLDDGSLKTVLLDSMPTLSADKKTYSFTLKSGVKFHNGETLTSTDVKYSLERLVKMQSMGSLLETVVGYEALQKGTAAELEGIKITDDTHFTITLSRVYTPFLSVLSTPYAVIYPAKACESAGENWGKTTLIGTGPFKLDSYTAGTGAELSKFADYHDGAAKIDKISYKFIEDTNTQVLEYQKGNIDFADLDNALYPVYSSNPALKDQIHSFQMAGGYFITCNVKTVNKKEVREALSLAIDRKAICESILHGTASVPNSFIPASIIGNDKNAAPYEYNPEKAKQLLAQAGYPSGYKLRVTINTKYHMSQTLATAIQEQAKAGGFDITVEPVDSAAWSDMKKHGGIDCSIANWYVDYNDPDSMLYPVSDARTDLTSSFWHNAQFKKLMDDGVQTDDTAKRQEIYQQAEHILTREEFADLPLINETKFYLLNPKVSGFAIGATNRIILESADIQ